MELQDIGIWNCRTLGHGTAGHRCGTAEHAIWAPFMRYAYVVLVKKCGIENLLWYRR